MLIMFSLFFSPLNHLPRLHRFISNELSLPLLLNNCFLFSLRFYLAEVLFFLSSNFRWCHCKATAMFSFDRQTRLLCRRCLRLSSPDADFNFFGRRVASTLALIYRNNVQGSILSQRHQLDWLSLFFFSKWIERLNYFLWYSTYRIDH